MIDDTQQAIRLVERECERAEEKGTSPQRVLERIAVGCYRLGGKSAALDIELKLRRAGLPPASLPPFVVPDMPEGSDDE